MLKRLIRGYVEEVEENTIFGVKESS